MLRIADDARGAPASVGEFVAGRYSRMGNGARKPASLNASAGTSVGGHDHWIRMVNETARGTIGLLPASAIRATLGEPASRPAKFSINH